jgi:hypothetical protein
VKILSWVRVLFAYMLLPRPMRDVTLRSWALPPQILAAMVEATEQALRQIDDYEKMVIRLEELAANAPYN